ncbi:hypothetical protein BJF78_14905 [Pseudonocardia sp. CNS-139]|nr:hypothetical protein BJF78_14905 [Pseudonocardia sp. CNS-139]
MSGPRAALVTGASSGIGLAVATALRALGHDLTVVARTRDRLTAARDTLAVGGAHVVAVAADLAEPDAPGRAVDAHLQAHGRLDVLVHSAGVGLFGALDEQGDRRVDLQIDLNLRALARLSAHGLRALRKAGAEHGKALVVAVSSLVGVEPQPDVVPYSMTKPAAARLLPGRHLECARHGVQFTAVCPALVDTPGASWAADGDKLPAEDVAQAVRFLLSTSPACFVPEIQLRTAEPFHLPDPSPAKGRA